MVYLGPLVCGFVNARITIPCKKPSRLPLAFRHVSLESGLSICLLTLKRQQLWSLDLEVAAALVSWPWSGSSSGLLTLKRKRVRCTEVWRKRGRKSRNEPTRKTEIDKWHPKWKFGRSVIYSQAAYSSCSTCFGTCSQRYSYIYTSYTWPSPSNYFPCTQLLHECSA